MASVEESKAALERMATPEFTRELSALIRSRVPLIYLVTSEERRLIEYLRHYTVAGGYNTFVWDCYQGLLRIKSMEPAGLITGEPGDELAMLDWVLKEAGQQELQLSKKREKPKTDAEDDEAKKDAGKSKADIYVLMDFHRFLEPNPTADLERRLRVLARTSSHTVVIMVGPHYASTPALDKDMRVLDFPLPNESEIKDTLYEAIAGISLKVPGFKKQVEAREEDIVKSAGGLTSPEIFCAFSKSICMHRDINIPTILKEKQEVIRKTGILEFFKPNVGIKDVGGLGNLIEFLRLRKACFTADAVQYGLPSPKGVLLIGVPGGGKSLAAKAAASLFEMPLLRLDFGALLQSHVGESERSARNATLMAERLAPCIVGSTKIVFDGKETSIEDVYYTNDSNELMQLEHVGNDFIHRFKKPHITEGADDTGKKIEISIFGVIRRKNTRKLLQITLDDGRTITVTDNHKIMVRTGNGTEWKEASALKSNDDIVCF